MQIFYFLRLMEKCIKESRTKCNQSQQNNGDDTLTNARDVADISQGNFFILVLSINLNRQLFRAIKKR